MTIDEYKQKVIDLFKIGNPTDEQYAEMAYAVLYTSESNDYKNVYMIDKEVLNESRI